MNNHHDIVYVEDNRKLDDEESNCFVCEWSIGEKMFINEKPVLPVKDVFVLTKEELDKEKIEFAKLHVEAALKAASEKVDVNCPKYAYGFLCDVKKDSIINSYPEINLL